MNQITGNKASFHSKRSEYFLGLLSDFPSENPTFLAYNKKQ